ncbi:YwiC-like family protein [Salinicoccus sesuvii]|uniref:YwiC-like family protein n=1 Tax=Salinicoccus sesuvii TaxID=868281 RepID=A0ABV7N4L9_9STAP
MKFKKQNQHGAWAMVFMPLLIGIAAGGFHPAQLSYMLGWLMMFFMADHILFFIKKRRKNTYGYLYAASLFFLLSVVLFIYPLVIEYRIFYFFLAMLPFGAVNAYFSYQKNERNIINDLSAIIIFSIGGGGIAFLNLHTFSWPVMFVIVLSALFFTSTALFVKTMVREKKNPKYQIASFLYHVIVFTVMLLAHWILGLAFLFSLLRAILVYGREWKMKQIGILEIIHATWVTVWTVMLLIVVV